jgi:tRNA threonylcarbamoyladenosine biosynthesis protein TsaE
MFREVGGHLYREVVEADLPEVANQILNEAQEYKIWLFTGEMGAGKTTLIKAMCEVLGVDHVMSSPTFSIVNEYLAREQRVFHFDFFRIKNEAEAYDIGAEEYFYSGSYCFIEWPEKIPGLIPADHAHVNLTLENNTFRTIALSVHDGQEKNRI